MYESISLPSGYVLTSARLEDRDDYVRLLRDGEIASFIPAIPQPYTLENADAWIRRRLDFVVTYGREISFCIRSPSGAVVGCVGIDDLDLVSAGGGELGYWLGVDHRRRGIAREAVTAFITYAFNRLALARLTAHTLHLNVASRRILSHAGFTLEETLVRHTRTASGIHDALRFSLTRSSWQSRCAAQLGVAADEATPRR